MVRTAAGLRWRTFCDSDEGLAVGLVGALTLTLGCDVALGVGLDERIDGVLIGHWWGAPFAVVLAISAAMATGSLVAILGDRRRRAATVLTGAIAAGAAAGSALLAAVSIDLAATGAAIGLAIAVATARALLRTPLRRSDVLLVVAIPIVLALGLRSASNPVGPLVLLIVAGALLATRAQPRPLAV